MRPELLRQFVQRSNLSNAVSCSSSSRNAVNWFAASNLLESAWLIAQRDTRPTVEQCLA